MDGAAQKIQSKNDDKNGASVDGVHVSEGGKGGGVGGCNIAMGRKVEEYDGRTMEKNKYPSAVADGGVDEEDDRVQLGRNGRKFYRDEG